MRRRSASGTPGPWSTTEMRSVVVGARRVEADRVVRIGAAGVLEQVHEHLADHRLVDVHGRELGRRRRRRRTGPRAPPRHRRRPRRAARRPASACAAGCSAPASMRERSSMLSTSRTSRRASCSMPPSSASRSCSGTLSRSAEAEAVIAVSGVRRSCETDCRSAVRRRSVSLSACSITPSCSRRARPRARPRMPQNDSSTADRLAVGPPVPRVDGEVAERDAAVADRQRQHAAVAAQRDDAGRRPGSSPARGARPRRRGRRPARPAPGRAPRRAARRRAGRGPC